MVPVFPVQPLFPLILLGTDVKFERESLSQQVAVLFGALGPQDQALHFDSNPQNDAENKRYNFRKSKTRWWHNLSQSF